MFRDLGIENKKQKSEIIVAMNTRLEEYSNVIKESKEFNKDIALLFIKKLTHAIMKKDFLNQPSMGLFPLQEQIVLEIYVDCAVFYMKSLNVFLDTILATGEQFCFLEESKIDIIKKEAQEKRGEFLDKIIMGEQVMKQNLFGN
jgi:hypothetical protein